MPHTDPQQQVRIIGRASSINVRKVLWTCAETGIAHMFDGDWENDARVTRRAELLSLNPNNQFPVLIDGDESIWESNTICRYLAARQGRADLLPIELKERAQVEQWMDWQSTDLNSAWRYAFMALVRKDPRYDRRSDIAASVAAWNAAMLILEQQLVATGAYVTGPVFTLADVALGVSINRWLLTPMPKPGLPTVVDYFESLGERPGFLSHVRNGIP